MKNKSVFDRALRVLEKLAVLRTFDDVRLAAIENRLATLDGEENSDAARKSALNAVNLHRIMNDKAINFTLVKNSDGKLVMKWDE